MTPEQASETARTLVRLCGGSEKALEEARRAERLAVVDGRKLHAEEWYSVAERIRRHYCMDISRPCEGCGAPEGRVCDSDCALNPCKVCGPDPITDRPCAACGR